MLISRRYGFFNFFLIPILSLLLIISPTAAEIYMDNFSEGKAKLKWNFFPHFFLDNLSAVKYADAPDGDGGIGILANSNAGGFAALSYALTEQVSDFYLEAFVYCLVTDKDKGSLSGIAFLVDPLNSRFYRFVCDFNGQKPSLNVAYVGKDTRHFPIYLKIWDEKEIPGGVPKKSGWSKMAIRVKGGKAIFYWNDKSLSGVIDVSNISKGFVGVYTNFVGGFGLAQTKVDSFILRIE